MRFSIPFAAAFAAVALNAFAAPESFRGFVRDDGPPVPADNALTYPRIELGKRLFFDPRLSGSRSMSCATCHNPALGWGDGLPTALGPGLQPLRIHTPTLLNAAYNERLMWDARHASLEEQALAALRDPQHMNLDPREMVKRLQALEGYRSLFELAYGSDGIRQETVAMALAAFERTLVSRESPFDRWQKGEARAVDDAIKRGFDLFRGKANCIACHKGPNFTDGRLHDTGVDARPGAYKTPSLRDAIYTAPYMHNGAYGTLRQVVEMYSRGGNESRRLDPSMRKLGLTAAEVDDLVAFLESLAGDPVVIAAPQLPY